MRDRGKLIAVVAGLYLLAFGLLAGMALDRMSYDRQRSEVLGRYEQALKDWQTYRIALEKRAETTHQ